MHTGPARYRCGIQDYLVGSNLRFPDRTVRGPTRDPFENGGPQLRLRRNRAIRAPGACAGKRGQDRLMSDSAAGISDLTLH